MPEPTIRNLHPEDASSLVKCFLSCYGETYPNQMFYDDELLSSSIAKGELRSVVAVVDNEIVGHTGLTPRHHTAIAAVAGNTVVSPHMRGQGLLGRLGSALRQRTLVEGFVGYIWAGNMQVAQLF